MIDNADNTTDFKICPDTSESKNGCEFCGYYQPIRKDYKCLIFMALDQKRLALQCNFCPLTGQLGPDWAEGKTPKIFAVWPDGTKLKISSIDDIKQKELFTFEALCVFEDKTSAWVPFEYIKNGEEEV